MIDRMHGGNIKGEGLIDFSVNINPLGPPLRLKNILAKNSGAISSYPQQDSKSLKIALANFHRIDSQNILTGNGSIELIYLIMQALKPKKVLMPVPAFTEYEFAARANGAELVFVKTKEKEAFKINASILKELIPDVDLVFLCNPNNPTGAYLLRNEISSISHICAKHNVMLVIDEAFMDFVEDAEKLTLVNKAARSKTLLVLRSLTKSFAIPGLRLGYVVSSKNLIRTLSRFQYPWNVNSLAQIVGEEVIKDKEYINKTKEFIAGESAYLYTNLKRINGLTAYPPSSNFIFCKLENGRTAGRLNKGLVKSRIVIRDCSNFRGLDNRFFRVAVRNRAENIKLIKEVGKWLRIKTKKK